jgi:hypothetical protein
MCAISRVKKSAAYVAAELKILLRMIQDDLTLAISVLSTKEVLVSEQV